jgi:GT2 family glycosyltransferase
MPSLLLSVVICTYDRPTDLERCLTALAHLESKPQIVVVDSASDPPCRDVVERHAERVPGILYVAEKQPGLSRARNRGVAESVGQIVAFLDDDAIPRPDWAQHVIAPFAADARIGCVGGTCQALFTDSPRPAWLSDRLLQFAGITRIGQEAREARSSVEWPFGANMAFRAEALAQVGGFPERLGRIGTTLLSGEESAVVEMLRETGWRVWLEPTAVVDHMVRAERCTPRYYWRRLWWAGASRARASRTSYWVALRLLLAAPLRLCLYAATRDRVHLYRMAETAGYFSERLKLRRHAA